MSVKKLTSLFLSAGLLLVIVLTSCSSPSANSEETTAAPASEQSSAQQVTKVPSLQADELLKLMQDEKIILLDTRSPKEYASGHLQSSRFVNFETFHIDKVGDIPKDAEIVLYCAVGGRSNRIAKQLISAGYQNVRELEGGIVKWKEQGHAVVNE